MLCNIDAQVPRLWQSWGPCSQVPLSWCPVGVFASEDGADVASPVSLIEWFLGYYEECHSAKVKPREAVVKAGELLFVPRGWWHLALNLEVSTHGIP